MRCHPGFVVPFIKHRLSRFSTILKAPGFFIMVNEHLGFPGGSVVKNPPAMQQMRVRFLGQEDSLEKEMATHFSILA